MKPQRIAFYKRESDFLEFYHQIKFVHCPHCQRTDQLILHGYLSGYDDRSSNKRITRGHRIFCSNRNRRQGCGRTFSILAAHILKNFTITTKNLWDFLNNILQGMNKFIAFSILNLPFCASTIYRLYQKINLRQNTLRTLLVKISPPPANVPSRNPLIKTILHIKSAFGRDSNPLSAFQSYFQTSLL